MLKKDKLRYNEYYDMQSVYDELYQQSRNNNNFYKLIEIIGSLDHNNGKKEKRIIKNCYNCEKIHTNKVKIKSYSIV